MKKTKSKPGESRGIPQMPFADALRKILDAPPQHKTAKKPQRSKSKRS
jgi:hypothetical protein